MATEWRVKRRGRKYYGVRTNGGATEKRTTGVTDRGNAEAIIRRWNREEADPSLAAARETTLEDGVRNFLSENDRREITADTRTFYEEKCGHLPRIFPGARLADIDATAVDKYINKRLTEVTQHTVSKELVALRGVLETAKRRGEYALDPRLVMPKKFATKYTPRKTFLTGAQVAAYLDAMTKELAAVVCFIVATSARRSEVGHARRRDVDVKAWRVYLRGTKTEGAERTVPIVEWVRPFLERAMRDAPGKDDLLFPSHWEWPYTSLRTAAASAICPICDGTGHVDGTDKKCEVCGGKGTGVPYASPTDLRRTCATWSLANGADLFAVSKLLGHADTTMLQRVYGRMDEDMLRARLVRENAGPVLVQDSVETVVQADPPDITEAEMMGLFVGQDGLEPSANGLRGRRASSKASAKRAVLASSGPALAQLRAQAWMLRGLRRAVAGDREGTHHALAQAAAQFRKAVAS